jgi:hypothetical protein
VYDVKSGGGDGDVEKGKLLFYFFMMSLARFFNTCKMNKGQKFTSSLGNMVKGTTQVNAYFLKLHFFVFERSQEKHNSLDYHNWFSKYFSLIVKFTCSKYSSLKNEQTFLHMSFYLPNVHQSF